MRRTTRPAEASRHFSPMSLSITCHAEPSGARVPSLITISPSAARSGAAGSWKSTSTAAMASERVVRVFMGPPSLPFYEKDRKTSCTHSFDEELVGSRGEPSGAPLGEEIGEAQGRDGVRVDREGLREEALEERFVLRLDRDGLGETDVG